MPKETITPTHKQHEVITTNDPRFGDMPRRDPIIKTEPKGDTSTHQITTTKAESGTPKSGTTMTPKTTLETTSNLEAFSSFDSTTSTETQPEIKTSKKPFSAFNKAFQDDKIFKEYKLQEETAFGKELGKMSNTATSPFDKTDIVQGDQISANYSKIGDKKSFTTGFSHGEIGEHKDYGVSIKAETVTNGKTDTFDNSSSIGLNVAGHLKNKDNGMYYDGKIIGAVTQGEQVTAVGKANTANLMESKETGTDNYNIATIGLNATVGKETEIAEGIKNKTQVSYQGVGVVSNGVVEADNRAIFETGIQVKKGDFSADISGGVVIDNPGLSKNPSFVIGEKLDLGLDYNHSFGRTGVATSLNGNIASTGPMTRYGANGQASLFTTDNHGTKYSITGNVGYTQQKVSQNVFHTLETGAQFNMKTKNGLGLNASISQNYGKGFQKRAVGPEVRIGATYTF